VDLYLKVRRAHFEEGLSGRQIARDFGVSRDSVAKMLAYSEPPGYRRTAPIKRPKLDPYTDQIDQWLTEDKTRPRKQRHTAKRIFERSRTSGEYLFPHLFFSITQYPYFWVSGKQGAVQPRCSGAAWPLRP